MNVERTAIQGVLLFTPNRHEDGRGFFSETFRADRFAEAVGPVAFVQENQSFSRLRGTVRGLHYQRPPSAQGKLVRVLRGSILDVAVDIRKGSSTFGRHVAVELTAASLKQIWIPRGFAHGFCTLEPDTEIAYKVDDYYSRADDFGLAWDDPALGIGWPVTPDEAVLSDKDRAFPGLAGLPDHFVDGATADRGRDS